MNFVAVSTNLEVWHLWQELLENNFYVMEYAEGSIKNTILVKLTDHTIELNWSDTKFVFKKDHLKNIIQKIL